MTVSANIFSDFENRIRNAVEAIGFQSENPLELSRVNVEPPRDPAHGDLASNAAMILTKQVGKPPRDVAALLSEELSRDNDIASVEIAGPGFINLRLADAYWTRHLGEVVRQGSQYGAGLVGKGKKVNVEYVSANPTGPMHVGHCRGAVVGDALANLLAFAGYDVTKEYYINDAGVQIGVLAQSVYLRYREVLGEEIGEIPEGLYPGEYLKPVAEMLKDRHGDALLAMSQSEWEPIVREAAINAMMDLIREDLAVLNVHHDLFFSEQTLHATNDRNQSIIDEMMDEMRKRGFVYDGRLPPPKGEVPEDWEDREQTLFKSTDVGDDMDRPLVKSDGTYTYFAADVAYFKNKYDRGFERMVFVLGADHGGYIKRLKAVARAIAGDEAELDVLLCNLVKLYRDGEPFRMSKRAGNFVTLRDVVEEVGKDAVRFMMLYRKAEAELDFDFAKVTEQSRDNPVFYVQYAHARIAAVFRKAAEEMPDLDLGQESLEKADLSLLSDPGELGLVRKMAEYPRMIEQAAKADEPHRVAFYLYDLASQLHSHWNKGKESPELRFINHKNAQQTLSRLALLRATASVIASGLAIVGVDAPEEMR